MPVWWMANCSIVATACCKTLQLARVPRRCSVPEKVPQTFANHARFDPLFHFVIVPIFLITWLLTIATLVRRPSLLAGWGVVFMTAAILGLLKARVYALKVQDRVIR